MDVDSSLDEIIKKTVTRRNVNRGRGRGSPSSRGRGRGGRTTTAGKRSGARRSANISNSSNHTPALTAPGYTHIEGASLTDIAAADKMERTLLVSQNSDVRKLGNSIKYVFDESGELPALLAGGSGAVNQAIKGIANARQKDLTGPDGALTIIAQPTFDGGSERVTFELKAVLNSLTVPENSDDLVVRPNSDPYKVAGAVAARLRLGERFGIITKGADGVFRSVESIIMSRIYLENDNIDVKIAPKLVEMNWDGLDSVGVHLAVLGRKNDK